MLYQSLFLQLLIYKRLNYSILLYGQPHFTSEDYEEDYETAAFEVLQLLDTWK